MISSFIKSFLILFIITDPLGNLPVFLTMTKNQGEVRRKTTLKVAVLTGFVMLLIFSLLGKGILELFNISLADFKIAGGVLLFVIAIKILIDNRLSASEDEEIGAVPLGIPLLVGPGAITTAIVLIGDFGLDVTLYAIAANFVLSWIIFGSSNFIYRIIGDTGAKIIAKIMAILIAAFAIKYMRTGIFEVIHLYFK